MEIIFNHRFILIENKSNLSSIYKQNFNETKTIEDNFRHLTFEISLFYSFMNNLRHFVNIERINTNLHIILVLFRNKIN